MLFTLLILLQRRKDIVLSVQTVHRYPGPWALLEISSVCKPSAFGFTNNLALNCVFLYDSLWLVACLPSCFNMFCLLEWAVSSLRVIICMYLDYS